MQHQNVIPLSHIQMLSVKGGGDPGFPPIPPPDPPPVAMATTTEPISNGG